MLIAKVLDKLFNRRNTFEVESLEGDIGGISLQDCLEWVNQMKEHITWDEENYRINVDTIVSFDSDVIMNISSIINNATDDPIFPVMENQAGKSVVVNEDETGFEYVKKPTLWETVYDFNNLSSELLESLQVGDLIYSSGDEALAEVDYCGTTFISIKTFSGEFVRVYSYSKEDDEWSCEEFENPIGTKLYKYSFVFTDGESVTHSLSLYSYANVDISSMNYTKFADIYSKVVGGCYVDDEETAEGGIINLGVVLINESFAFFVYVDLNRNTVSNLMTPYSSTSSWTKTPL